MRLPSLLRQSDQILALGINCSSPLLYNQALAILKNAGKALITYPNSGEVYDGSTQTWKPKDKDALTLVEHSKDWHDSVWSEDFRWLLPHTSK